MNIIFYRYRSICEPDYIDAFKKLGINVIEDTSGAREDLTLDEKIRHLGELIADNTPLFIFSIDYFPFISLVCDRIGLMYIAMSVDCPVFEIFNNAIRLSCNRIFLFDKAQYESVATENPKGIFYLPLGAASERLDATLGETDKYLYDISFVGSLYKEKDPYLTLKLPSSIDREINENIEKQMSASASGQELLEETLTEEQIKEIKKAAINFYPSDMSVRDISRYVALNDYISPHITYLERTKLINSIAENITGSSLHLFTLSDTSDLSKNISVHKGANSLTEMPFVFRQSKINLNMTTRSITTGLPQRIWDILGCRGFLLTNDQPEITDYFTPGRHLVTYSDHEDMLEKIEYYLSHDEEREKIAACGYEEVKNTGTVLHRILEMTKKALS